MSTPDDQSSNSTKAAGDMAYPSTVAISNNFTDEMSPMEIAYRNRYQSRFTVGQRRRNQPTNQNSRRFVDGNTEISPDQIISLQQRNRTLRSRPTMDGIQLRRGSAELALDAEALCTKMLAYNEATGAVTHCLFGVVVDILTDSSLPDKGERSEALFRKLDKLPGGYRRAGPLIRVLRAYAQAGKPDKAQEIAQEIRRRFGPLRIVLEGFVVQAYGNSGDLEKADSLFRQLMLRNSTALVQSNFHLDMMRVFSKSEDKKYRVKEIFEQLRTVDAFYPNTKSYNLLIASLAGSTNATEQATMYYNQMLTSYRRGNGATRPNAHTYASLVTAIKECGSIDLGLQILEWQYELYRETNSSDLRPSPKVYSSILLLLTKSNNPDKFTIAKSLWDEMRRLKVQWTEGICRLTLGIVAESQQISPVAFSMAREIWKILLKLDEVTSKTANYFLLACANVPQNDRVVSSTSAFEAFKICCRRGIVDRRVIKSFKEAVAPQPISFFTEQLFGNISMLPSHCSRNIPRIHHPGSLLDL